MTDIRELINSGDEPNCDCCGVIFDYEDECVLQNEDGCFCESCAERFEE